MNKGKKLAAQFSPTAKARFGHRSLLQNYDDLVKKAEVKRKNLQIANQKKLKLHAEVKFLRRRYKSLLQNRSGGLQFRLRTKPKSRFFVAQPSNAKDQSSKIGEDIDEYQFNVEALKADAFRKSSVETDLEANDLKLPVCREIGHGWII